MFDKFTNKMDQIRSMLGKTEITNDDKDMLGQSLFYYCSGIDPTPISAFAEKMPLFIYVDSFVYMPGDFSTNSKELYNRIKKLKCKLIKEENLAITCRLKEAKAAEISLWKTKTGEEFLLLFVQGDAVQCYKSLYSDKENYIQPKCICNYRYEFYNLDIFTQLEKRVEYILGYCSNDKYRCVGEYKYLGDYEENTKVKLYHRNYYYLF